MTQHLPHNAPRRPPPRRNLPVKRHLPVNMLLVENRIRSFLEHSTHYAFRGPARLARECGVSEATICRLLTGYGSPSYAVLIKITRAFEKEFKRCIDPREVAALDGRYPTPTVCEIVGCKGCTPQEAWNCDDTLKPEYSTESKSASDEAARDQRKEER